MVLTCSLSLLFSVVSSLSTELVYDSSSGTYLHPPIMLTPGEPGYFQLINTDELQPRGACVLTATYHHYWDECCTCPPSRERVRSGAYSTGWDDATDGHALTPRLLQPAIDVHVRTCDGVWLTVPEDIMQFSRVQSGKRQMC